MTFLKPKVFGNWKPPKNPNKPRVDKRAEWEGNSKEHLKLIRQLPSCVSGKRPCDSHHLKIKSERGMGMRSRDKWAVPLTRDEHDHLEAQGSRNERRWFKERGVENPFDLASALWNASPNLETMERIIAAHVKPRKPKRAKKCAECGVNYADPPSDICPGCEAYKEHTAF